MLKGRIYWIEAAALLLMLLGLTVMVYPIVHRDPQAQKKYVTPFFQKPSPTSAIHNRTFIDKKIWHLMPKKIELSLHLQARKSVWFFKKENIFAMLEKMVDTRVLFYDQRTKTSSYFFFPVSTLSYTNKTLTAPYGSMLRKDAYRTIQSQLRQPLFDFKDNTLQFKGQELKGTFHD